MPRKDPRTLAEKIAQLIEAESAPADLGSIQAAIESINQRLDAIEGTPQAVVHPSVHPSAERFAVAEALADEVFANMKQEKSCMFEPAKACDHCSMCSSRGF